MKNVASLKDVERYWVKKNIPQQWYSNKLYGSLQWFNEMEKKRYNLYYPYLPVSAEFSNHSGEKVLEIGVGIGTDLVQYSKYGSRVFGVDLGADQIELTKLNFQLRNLAYEDLKVANAEQLPFDSETFDLVYSFGVLHHTPDTQKAISEVKRVLKKDGQAIIMLYARGWKHYVKRCFIQGILRGKIFKHRGSWQAVYNEISEVNGNSPKTGVYSKKQVRELFKDFNCVNIQKKRMGEFWEYKPYNSIMLPKIFNKISEFFGLESIFGENWLVVLGKHDELQRKSVFDVFFKHY